QGNGNANSDRPGRFKRINEGSTVRSGIDWPRQPKPRGTGGRSPTAMPITVTVPSGNFSRQSRVKMGDKAFASGGRCWGSWNCLRSLPCRKPRIVLARRLIVTVRDFGKIADLNIRE